MSERHSMEPGERTETAATWAMSAVKSQTVGGAEENPSPTAVDARTVEALVLDWPEMAKSAADEIIKKHGRPKEAIPRRLIWYANGPRKRTAVYRHEIPHDFPQPHTDVVEQLINYHVPPEKVGELAKFDGDVIVERTAGEVSARCDIEAANFLAIDMVHEIVTGKLTTEEACKVYSENTSAYVMNRPAPYAEVFQVEPPREETADKDETTIAGAMARQGVEKAKVIVGQDGAATRRGRFARARTPRSPGPQLR